MMFRLPFVTRARLAEAETAALTYAAEAEDWHARYEAEGKRADAARVAYDVAAGRIAAAELLIEIESARADHAEAKTEALTAQLADAVPDKADTELAHKLADSLEELVTGRIPQQPHRTDGESG
ncbi:hypothetical protein ACOKM3_14155 [Streptomyces sp. BH106]|uniref:hypothetical protein n=1 Tax=Streptomyces sp. BH106 TaxID=3410409 RepID=UPI003CE9D955